LSEKYRAHPARRLDLGVMEAFHLLFSGACDTFAFYLARRDGIRASRFEGDREKARASLAQMAAVLDRAERLTRRLIVLAREDPRLGFHPEAEAHQFSPALLAWRLETLARSRERLAEIAGAVEAGRPWPLSLRETTGAFWRAARGPRKEIVIAGKTPPEATGRMEVRTYDLCGVRTAGVYAADAAPDGSFRLVLPAPPDDPVERPAWIVIRRGEDHNNGGTTWIWPPRPEFPEPRLNQHRLTGDNFARLVYDEAR
jgi:hypothetical protein